MKRTICFLLFGTTLLLAGCGSSSYENSEVSIKETIVVNSNLELGNENLAEETQETEIIVDVEKYLNVCFYGKNMIGRLDDIQLDYDMLKKDFGNRAEEIYNLLDFSLRDARCENDGLLENGKEERIIFQVEEERLSRYGIKVASTEISVLVEGLEELEYVDAFSGLELVINGANGYNKVTLSADYHPTYLYYEYVLEDVADVKNGDVVTVYIAENARLAYLSRGIMPESYKKEFVIEGLHDVKTFDGFAGITVDFGGISPVIYGTLDSRAEKYDELKYEVGNDGIIYDGVVGIRGKYANGDVVTVTINKDSILKCIEKYGEAPESTSKDFLVEGFPIYIKSFEEIPNESWELFCSEWESNLPEEMADIFVRNLNNPESVQKVKYIGRAGSLASDLESNEADSWFYATLLFEIEAKNTSTEELFKYYYYLDCDGMNVDSEGNIYVKQVSHPYGQYNSWTEKLSGYAFLVGDNFYVGFDSIASLYEEIVLNNRQGFNTSVEFIEGYEYVPEY